jgi:Zn-dependent peptidase ImmA (M78 family)
MRLTPEKISEIESIAGTALQDAYNGAPIYEISAPISLSKVLTYHDLKLKTADFTNGILRNVAGVFSRTEKSIYIPKDESYQRNSFTIAHEIGHYLLHKNIDTEVFYRHQSDLLINENLKMVEAEANWFAASLLMPNDLLQKYKVCYKNDESSLSILFGVSQQAMHWRLINTANLTRVYY